MTFDDFAKEVARQFDLDSIPGAEETLVEDLGLDSLDSFNLVLLVEELAAVGPNPPDLPYPLMTTMGDAYRYFTEIAAAQPVEVSQ